MDHKGSKLKIKNKKLCLFFILLCVFILVSIKPKSNEIAKAQSNEIKYEKFTVVLDAGHGDWDCGMEGLNSLEKDINLDITLKLGEFLEKYEDIEVVYTRKGDDLTWSDNSTHNLYERVKISYDANADIFISLHCNGSYESSEYRGVEVWYNPKSDESYNLSSMIQEELASLEYSFDRGVKTYDEDNTLAVLEHNEAPSALIELGFISNFEDEQYLTNSESQSECALAIANAVINYKENNWDKH